MIKPKQQKENWEEEFDKLFTRKSKGLADKGQYRDDWFVKDGVTSKEVKSFIRQLIPRQLIQQVKEEVDKGWINYLKHQKDIYGVGSSHARQTIKERMSQAYYEGFKDGQIDATCNAIDALDAPNAQEFLESVLDQLKKELE